MSGLDEGYLRGTAKVYKDWHDAMAEALREGQKNSAAEPQPKDFGKHSALSAQLSALDHKSSADILLQFPK
jgi:hypothetical protein